MKEQLNILTQYHGCDYCKMNKICAQGNACIEYKNWVNKGGNRIFFAPSNPLPNRKIYEQIFKGEDE